MMREPGSAARRRDGGGASAGTVDQEAMRCNQKPLKTYSDEMDRASLVQEHRSAASFLSRPQSKLVEARIFLWALTPGAPRPAPAHQLFPEHPAMEDTPKQVDLEGAAGPARSFGQQRRHSVGAVQPLRSNSEEGTRARRLINSEEGTRARRLWQRAIVAATSGGLDQSSTKNAHRSW